jgi:hypothetical protein
MGVRLFEDISKAWNKPFKTIFCTVIPSIYTELKFDFTACFWISASRA